MNYLKVKQYPLCINNCNSISYWILIIYSINHYQISYTYSWIIILFTGILVGMMKHYEIEQSIVAAGITSASGSIAITLITYIIVSMNDTYGYSQFLNIGPSVMDLLIFIVVGAIGGAIGYYIIREIFSQKTREHHF